LFVLALASLLWPTGGRTQEETDLDALLTRAREIYLEEGPGEAKALFERAVAQAREVDDASAELTALRGLGNCYRRLASFDEALAALTSALALADATGDPVERGKVHNSFGLTYWDLGRYPEAERHLLRAAALGEEGEHPILQGTALNNLSLVNDERGDSRRALAQYQQVLEIYAGQDFSRGESDTLGNIGLIYHSLGLFSEALEYHQRAFEISQELELGPSMSIDLGNQGLALLGLGDPRGAMEKFDQALELAGKADMPQDAAFWSMARGRSLLWLGRHDEALESFRSALATYQRIEARGEWIDALLDLGDMYLRLGDVVSGEEHLQQAARLARAVGHPARMMMSQLALGDLQVRRGLNEEAARFYSAALQRAREVDDRATVAKALISLSGTLLESSQHQAALERSLEAREIARKIEATALEVAALVLTAQAHLQANRAEEALSGLVEAESLGGLDIDTAVAWRLYHARAGALEHLGRKEEAVAALREAIGVIESVRDRLKEQRFRSGWVQDKYRVYVDLVRALLDLGQVEAAFEASEGLRARSHMELLEHRGRLATDPASRREIELRERIRVLQLALREEHNQPRPERRQQAVETLSAELMEAERQYQEYLDDRGAGRPRGSGGPALMSLAELQESLDPSEAVLEYVIGPESVMSFVVTTDGVETHQVSIRQEDLETRVGLLRDLIARRDGGWFRPARGLASVLLAPAFEAGDLDGVDRITVVPHGVLHYVPFAALPLGPGAGRLVIDEFAVRYATIARAMGSSAPGAGRQSVMGMAPGRSRLRHAEAEVRTLGKFFADPLILVGLSATEAAFKQRAGDYSMLHLATHGHFNKINPLFSGLELEPDQREDGRLEVHEILNLDLEADLVTLSACNTALGGGYFHEVPAGDEFVGLTRAFLVAGSRSVLATLWQVDDRSTLSLMTDFYRDFEGAGDPVAAADSIASAQRTVRGETGTEHPFHWAPFVLVGGPGAPDRIAAAKSGAGVRTENQH
jgi:CHAT domain-containing protein/Tfp pilus assembly protein PilF